MQLLPADGMMRSVASDESVYSPRFSVLGAAVDPIGLRGQPNRRLKRFSGVIFVTPFPPHVDIERLRAIDAVEPIARPRSGNASISGMELVPLRGEGARLAGLDVVPRHAQAGERCRLTWPFCCRNPVRPFRDRRIGY